MGQSGGPPLILYIVQRKIANQNTTVRSKIGMTGPLDVSSSIHHDIHSHVVGITRKKKGLKKYVTETTANSGAKFAATKWF